MITITLADMLLNYAFRNEEASVYAGLIDEEDVEITGYDGDRKPITFDEPESVGNKRIIVTDEAVAFENMPACEVTAIGLYTDDDGGDLLLVIPLVDGSGSIESVEVLEGQTLRVNAGSCKIDIDDVERGEE